MKYEAKIDLRNANTSHALLAELVGCDRRVLDVGCAGGDLGRVLMRRGCRVAGVESDRAAAEVAERVLDEVLTGDVNDLDLVRHFGKESFDVVVFGDVLEHLADPIAVLKKVRPLLTDAGSVVASIPNVAHGSVRLALLKGRFDYRPLGLLDSTHLRFFTRGSVHKTFREAGLVPVDMRRTTAGVFDTEIGVRRGDFDEGVVDAVEGDPESTTYQFVVRAVPEDSSDAIAIGAPLPRPDQPPARTRIGLYAAWEPDDLRTALVVRVTHAEIGRRLPGASIRSFSSAADLRASPHDGGIAVEPLGPWSPGRASHLASELDCIVVVGDLPSPRGPQEGGGDPARFLLEGPGDDVEGDCPVLWSAVRLPGESLRTPAGSLSSPTYAALVDDTAVDLSGRAPEAGTETVPDPLLLLPRLLGTDALARRLAFVRIMGWFPMDGPAIVLEAEARLLPHARAVSRALDAALAGTGTSLVIVPSLSAGTGGAHAAEAISGAMATPAYRVPDDALVDDVVAVVANAAAVAGCSSSTMALGLAYGVRAAQLDPGVDPSLSRLTALFADLEGVAARREEAPGQPGDGRLRPEQAALAAVQSALDVHFDRVAAIADAVAAGRPHPPDSRPALPPSEHVAAMELAHRRMQQRLDAERHAVADHLDALHHRHRAELGRSRTELGRLRAERDDLDARLRDTVAGPVNGEAELRQEFDRVTAELEALRGIRILRLLRPARAVYARLRGGRL